MIGSQGPGPRDLQPVKKISNTRFTLILKTMCFQRVVSGTHFVFFQMVAGADVAVNRWALKMIKEVP
jgi:hypothetical protein